MLDKVNRADDIAGLPDPVSQNQTHDVEEEKSDTLESRTVNDKSINDGSRTEDLTEIQLSQT